MKRKRILLGLWVVLFMLTMTACGKSQNAASEPVQTPNANEQIDEALVISESTVSESLKADETALEDLGQSNKQKDKAETQDNSKAGEAPQTQTGEFAAQEDESALQERAAEIEGSQEEAENKNLPAYGNNYYDVTNVVLYLEIYDELPPNYITKSEAQALGWEGGSVEKYKEGAAIGGDYFGNREGLLPTADGRSYIECDIDTHGYSSRGSRRLVFSNDGLYFYTSDHYENFSEVTVTENYEVVW